MKQIQDILNKADLPPRVLSQYTHTRLGAVSVSANLLSLGFDGVLFLLEPLGHLLLQPLALLLVVAHSRLHPAHLLQQL